jgi:hypothetical protein
MFIILNKLHIFKNVRSIKIKKSFNLMYCLQKWYTTQKFHVKNEQKIDLTQIDSIGCV